MELLDKDLNLINAKDISKEVIRSLRKARFINNVNVSTPKIDPIFYKLQAKYE